MGLETVEFIMELEERFGFEFPEADAERIRTFDDLHRYIIRRLDAQGRQPATERVCPTMAAFHRLRRALMEQLGIPRHRIRPETPMEELIPPAGRCKAWWRIDRSMGMELPALRWTWQGFWRSLTRPVAEQDMAYEFRPAFATVGGTARAIVGRNAETFPGAGLSDRQVWDVIVGIVVAEHGVPSEAIRPDAGVTRVLGDDATGCWG